MSLCQGCDHTQLHSHAPSDPVVASQLAWVSRVHAGALVVSLMHAISAFVGTVFLFGFVFAFMVKLDP